MTVSASTYTFASFSSGESLGIRFGGPGLGNLLFPWARAVVFAKKHNLPRIASTWKTVKIGPLLRGELDKRTYDDLFIERGIGGTKKFFLLHFAKHYDEERALDALSSRDPRPKVIRFEGMENLFEPILADHEIVREELLKIVAPKHKKAAESFASDGVSVHIRMGDFQEAPSEEILRTGAWNYRLPLRWYRSVIEKIRTKTGKETPVYLFSDGTDEELRELLEMPGVRRLFFGSAIADMLALSRSRVLVASASTFSMWASYLGRMPVIWYPTLLRQKLYREGESAETELDYHSVLPDIYIDALKE